MNVTAVISGDDQHPSPPKDTTLRKAMPAVCPGPSLTKTDVKCNLPALGDCGTPEKCEQRPSSSFSFLRFVSIDGQTYEPRPHLTKRTIYDALTAQSSTIVCTTASNCLPGLSFLQSHPSFSSLLQSASGSFALTDGKIHPRCGETGRSLEPLLDVPPVTLSPLQPASTSSVTTISSALPALRTHVAIAPKAISDDQSTSSTEYPISSNGITSHPAVLRTKNREAARKCRQKKKNYILQLEKDFKELKQKYAACLQENDDLKRLILQRFNIDLPPKKPSIASNEVRILPSIAPHPMPHNTPVKAAPTTATAAAATSPGPRPTCPLAVTAANAIVASTVPAINSSPVAAGQQVHLILTPSPTESFKNLHIRDEFGLLPAMYTGLAGNKALPQETLEPSTTFGVPAGAVFPHPAAEVEARRGREATKMQDMRVLGATQGQHAILRLSMEEKILKRMHPRQPCLFSHHPLAAQLDGSLDSIDFCDVLNNPEDAETIGWPHLLMERQQGIL
ncbi:hypothetical protein SprV_0200864800 [Sparganum proliferum]